MKQATRQYNFLDHIIGQIDQCLKTVFDKHQSERDYPGNDYPEKHLNEKQRRDVAGMMRVNHTGEVCAQALYYGQALTAKLDHVRTQMEQAAKEEGEHLAWCEQRLAELNSHTSYLNLLWYCGSFIIGAGAGLAGDKWSLGFVAETEHQVHDHLQLHIERISRNDERSKAVLKQMQIDEDNHAKHAIDAGAVNLPQPVKHLMKLSAKVMTKTTYWV